VREQLLQFVEQQFELVFQLVLVVLLQPQFFGTVVVKFVERFVVQQ